MRQPWARRIVKSNGSSLFLLFLFGVPYFLCINPTVTTTAATAIPTQSKIRRRLESDGGEESKNKVAFNIGKAMDELKKAEQSEKKLILEIEEVEEMMLELPDGVSGGKGKGNEEKRTNKIKMHTNSSSSPAKTGTIADRGYGVWTFALIAVSIIVLFVIISTIILKSRQATKIEGSNTSNNCTAATVMAPRVFSEEERHRIDRQEAVDLITQAKMREITHKHLLLEAQRGTARDFLSRHDFV